MQDIYFCLDKSSKKLNFIDLDATNNSSRVILWKSASILQRMKRLVHWGLVIFDYRFYDRDDTAKIIDRYNRVLP